jgi:hypothetical protein
MTMHRYLFALGCTPKMIDHVLFCLRTWLSPHFLCQQRRRVAVWYYHSTPTTRVLFPKRRISGSCFGSRKDPRSTSSSHCSYCMYVLFPPSMCTNKPCLRGKPKRHHDGNHIIPHYSSLCGIRMHAVLRDTQQSGAL